MVTSEPVGFCRKSSSNLGMSGTASGNSSSKNRRTSSSLLVVAKLRGPSNSQNSVQVNEPSGFGSAIIMKLLRGQMWSAFFSMRHALLLFHSEDLQATRLPLQKIHWFSIGGPSLNPDRHTCICD